MKQVIPLSLALVFVLASTGSALETADEIQACVRDNFPDDSSIQTVLFKSRDRTGAVRDSRATIYWRKFPDGLAKVMIRVSDPPKQRGVGILLLEKEDGTDRFLYLPALRKVRRISRTGSSGSLLGTDFTYEDLERIQGLRSDLEWRRLDDSSVGETSVYVLESSAAPGAAGEIARVVSSFDKATCVLLQSEFYERGGHLRKVLHVNADKIESQGDQRIPRAMRMEDLLEESSTDLVVEAIELGADIPDRRFSRKELMIGRR